MRKDIRKFLAFLNDELLYDKQKLYKWQEDWVESFLEDNTVPKEKYYAQVLKRKDNCVEHGRPGKLPDGGFSGSCFREREV